jgi:hypothetical protein
MKHQSDSSTLNQIDALVSEAIDKLRKAYRMLPGETDGSYQDIRLREDLHDVAEGNRSHPPLTLVA